MTGRGRADGLPREAPSTLRAALRAAEAALERAGIGENVADARLLLAEALGVSPSWLFAHDDAPIAAAAWPAFRRLVNRRRRREPLQHLLGAHEFWSLRLEVGRGALIPRPETEVLVEAALGALRAVERPRIADVGTGTGAIALALAAELPRARVVATDVSAEALDLARRNAGELGCEDRVTFREGALAAPLRGDAPFDAVLANLPYVTEAEWEQLEPEVRDFEPRLALVGGPEGTEIIRALVDEAPALLVPGGFLGLEVGHRQAGAVMAHLASRGWSRIAARQDFAGIDRVVEAWR